MKQPVSPPQPIIRRPLKFKPFTRKDRPRTKALMGRVKKIMERDDISQGELAKEWDTVQQSVCEWLSGEKAPLGEMTLLIQQWCEKMEKKGSK